MIELIQVVVIKTELNKQSGQQKLQDDRGSARIIRKLSACVEIHGKPEPRDNEQALPEKKKEVPYGVVFVEYPEHTRDSLFATRYSLLVSCNMKTHRFGVSFSRPD